MDQNRTSNEDEQRPRSRSLFLRVFEFFWRDYQRSRQISANVKQWRSDVKALRRDAMKN